MSAAYKAPAYLEKAFNCPFCGAYAKQDWAEIGKIVQQQGYNPEFAELLATVAAECANCERYSIWRYKDMIYPLDSAAPLPNPDMPDDVKQDYEEARSILSISPRGAAALLRLAVQKLCKHLGEPGDNINTDIASLVQKGLPQRLQQALDSVRVVGNNAVHPGQLDLKDNAELATKLFTFLNIIVTNRITEDKMIDEFYTETVPANLQQAITNRDAPRPAGGAGR
jgi:transcription elongation factor Elf1